MIVNIPTFNATSASVSFSHCCIVFSFVFLKILLTVVAFSTRKTRGHPINCQTDKLSTRCLVAKAPAEQVSDNNHNHFLPFVTPLSARKTSHEVRTCHSITRHISEPTRCKKEGQQWVFRVEMIPLPFSESPPCQCPLARHRQFRGGRAHPHWSLLKAAIQVRSIRHVSEMSAKRIRTALGTR
jgi:hypothetical protein